MITSVCAFLMDYFIVLLKRWKQSNFTYNPLLCYRKNIITITRDWARSAYSQWEVTRKCRSAQCTILGLTRCVSYILSNVRVNNVNVSRKKTFFFKLQVFHHSLPTFLYNISSPRNSTFSFLACMREYCQLYLGTNI